MSEPRVYIAQVLCPSRHAILVSGCESRDGAQARCEVVRPLEEAITRMIAEGQINPWCGICGEPPAAWHIEVRRTRFGSLEEAAPELRAMHERNMVAAALSGGHPGPGKTR